MDPISMGLAGLSLGASFLGQEKANKTNLKIAREQMRFQERMSNTAYQRSVRDIGAAGLNPGMLYGGHGGPSSTPPGSSTRVENSLAAASQMANLAQVELMRSQARKNDVEAANESTRGGLIEPEFAIRSALAQAEIELKGVSGSEIAARADLARQQLRELIDTFPDRRQLPGLERVQKQLDNIFATGSLQERLTALELANALTRANIDWSSSRGDLGKALSRVLLPWLQKSAVGSEKLSELVDAFSKLPFTTTEAIRDSVNSRMNRGAQWLKDRGLGTGKPRVRF